MAYTATIKCIKKSDRDNAWERITHVGGDGWSQTQEKTIQEIDEGSWEYYVGVGGKRVKVVVAVSRFGNKYLKTESDGEAPNNLLSLPECP